jgi:uroporphyrinogen decarboxylase
MDSRTRVELALSHQEPDKVPIDLGATENTTITRLAYQNLRRFLNLPVEPHPFVINRQMDAVFPQEDLLRRFEVDFRPLRPAIAPGSEDEKDPGSGSFVDELGIRWQKAAYYFDMVEHPLRHALYEQILAFNWPDPYDPSRVLGLRQQAKELSESTPYAIVLADLIWGPFELGCALRGFDQFCIDLLQEPKLAETLLDLNLQLSIGFYDAYLSEVGDRIQVVGIGDDLCMQTGPVMSPAIYRKMIKPRHKALVDFIRSKTTARVFMHCCGSVYDLLPELIEIGIDIISPVQISAARMDPARLKREYGDQIVFWGGGVDTQRMLPYGSLEQIRDQVKAMFDVFAPGGGFVFVPVHNIQADISPERILAVYDTALEKRAY